MAAHIRLALDNLGALLAEGTMSLSNVVQFNIYTTNVDEFIQHAGILGERTGAAGLLPGGRARRRPAPLSRATSGARATAIA
jgi:enamine deaminase RidA (YjgF/YER057c/UK114 family)